MQRTTVSEVGYSRKSSVSPPSCFLGLGFIPTYSSVSHTWLLATGIKVFVVARFRIQTARIALMNESYSDPNTHIPVIPISKPMFRRLSDPAHGIGISGKFIRMFFGSTGCFLFLIIAR